MGGYIFLCLRNIFRKSTRSVLTMLGVAIGVCSVIIINAVSDAGQTAVCDELNSLGLNSITVKCDGDILMDDSDVEIIRSVNGVIDASSVNSIPDVSTVSCQYFLVNPYLLIALSRISDFSGHSALLYSSHS